jgi:hypothetical protein
VPGSSAVPQRHVEDLNHKAAAGRGELFVVWRNHAIFTDSPFETIQAEGWHRDHAVIEQEFADRADGPLGHLPSGSFCGERGLACLRRHQPQPAPCCRVPGQPRLYQGPRRHPAPRPHRRRCPNRPAAAAGTSLHLPEGRHRQARWMNLFEAACGPPPAQAA